MIVYKIDHSISLAESRTDKDSIEKILRNTRTELKAIDKKNSAFDGFSILKYLSPVVFTGFAVKKVYDYCKYTLDKIKIYETCLKKIENTFTDIKCITQREALLNFPNTKECAVGYYTLHPIDSKCLIKMDNYHGILSKEKDEELIYLLGRMGAIRVQISTRELDKNGHKHETGVYIPKEYIGADINAKTNSAHNIENKEQSERIVKFEGKINSIDNQLLDTSCWFKSDVQLNNIFKSRLATDNRMKSFSYRSSHNNQFDFNFSIAAKLISVLENDTEANIEAKLKFEFEKLQNRERIFEVTFGE